MVPKVVHIESINTVSRKVRTNNKNEFDQSKAKIMPLWMKAYEDSFCSKDNISYGVYHNYASDVNGDYDVSVAVESNQLNGEKLQIKSGRYLKFVSEGEMPKAVIEGWQYIWKYFSENKDYTRKYGTDFEKYIPDFQGVEIYISIK